jgi:alkaline phosphatase
VTADHETGGTGVAYQSHKVNQPEGLHLNFSTKGHTGTVVPIFAYGAGAAKFSGIFQNRELPEMIEELIK